MSALAASEQPEGEIGSFPGDAEQFMSALCGRPTASPQPDRGASRSGDPMRERVTGKGLGQISPAHGQHRPASAHGDKINRGQ